MTERAGQFYIGGQWVAPSSSAGDSVAVVNPATEEIIARLAMADAEDVDRAVKAAAGAFASFAAASPEERYLLLKRVCDVYKERSEELARAVSEEMGAPLAMSRQQQVTAGLGHFAAAARLARDFEFETTAGTTVILKEPIGVCALITPWNWPLNQIACKVAPALAAGCTMVLKPSELAPLSALLLAEILDQAGVPAGVLNLVNGTGPVAGAALTAHPRVDMVSFTGSTRAGVAVARAAAPTVKRVAQELGGKSPNILLDDVDFGREVSRGVYAVCNNSGQSCNAPTRMLVPNSRMDEAAAIAGAAAGKVRPGHPSDEAARMGPVVSRAQFDKIQKLIRVGVEEGARLVAGGEGRPEGLERGYYVRPTVFSHVSNHMTVAREEIFGPVLVLVGYENEDDAIEIANDTPYGLAGFVSSADPARALSVARRIRAGQVNVNGAWPDFNAPFGGYKQSGNGREWGRYGLEEFLEVKAILGGAPAPSR